MPSLPSVTTDFLDAVKDALKQGTDLGSNVRGAAQNYLRAQDMASVLDLLQKDGLTTGVLTATGGTTTTVTEEAATFTEGQQVGNIVEFESDTTTTDLQGLRRRIIANTGDTLTLDEALPSAPAAGDTYKIVGAMVDYAVDDLREGRGLADSPRGNVYGEYRVVYGAMRIMMDRLGGSFNDRKMADLETVSGSTKDVLKVDFKGGRIVADELRGMRVTVSGEDRYILTHTEDGEVTLTAPLSSAPSSGTSVSVTVPEDDFGASSTPKFRVHAGAQPGENMRLSDLISQLQSEVESYTLPT